MLGFLGGRLETMWSRCVRSAGRRFTYFWGALEARRLGLGESWAALGAIAARLGPFPESPTDYETMFKHVKWSSAARFARSLDHAPSKKERLQKKGLF